MTFNLAMFARSIYKQYFVPNYAAYYLFNGVHTLGFKECSLSSMKKNLKIVFTFNFSLFGFNRQLKMKSL